MPDTRHLSLESTTPARLSPPPAPGSQRPRRKGGIRYVAAPRLNGMACPGSSAGPSSAPQQDWLPGLHPDPRRAAQRPEADMAQRQIARQAAGEKVLADYPELALSASWAELWTPEGLLAERARLHRMLVAARQAHDDGREAEWREQMAYTRLSVQLSLLRTMQHISLSLQRLAER